MEHQRPRSRRGPPLLSTLKLRFLVLLMALFGVAMMMRNLRSDGFQKFLEQIFSPNNAWSWCPVATQEVRLVSSGQVVNTPAQIQGFCLVQVEAVEADAAAAATFRPILVARNASGEEVTLEADLAKGLFRARGLPFGAQKLAQDLKAIGQP